MAQRKGVPLDSVMYLGIDRNDLPALKIVGLPIVVADAYPEAANAAFYRTVAPGGRGAVREICDLIYQAFHERSNL